MKRRTILFYALPNFAFAMPAIPVYVLLPAFYADSLGLGLTATGLALFAARAIDVFSDPLVGFASDRFATRWGRRKPWILAGAVLAGIGVVRLFQPPADLSVTYLLIWVVVLYVGWTMLAVPYTAWGAEISDDYDARSRITGGREGAMLIGIVAAASVPPLAASQGMAEGEALGLLAWLTIIAGAPLVVLLLWRVPEGPAVRGGSARVSLSIGALRTLLSNRPFARLLGAWFINGLANGFPMILFPLYLKYALGADDTTRGLFILVYFLAGLAAIPLWLALSRRFGKHRVWCWAMLAACAAFVWVPLIGEGGFAAFFVVCVVTGMALGADLSLPPSMQADVVDFDTLRTGQRRAGMFFALWSMSTKLALGGAALVAFPALDLLGFDPAADGATRGIVALAVIYAVVPVVFKLCAVATIWHHPITRRRHDVIRRRLQTRAARGAAATGR